MVNQQQIILKIECLMKGIEKKLLLFTIYIFFSFQLLGQTQCLFDDDLNYSSLKNQQYEEVNRNIRKALKNAKNRRTAFEELTIPLVVHIIHTGGEIGSLYNPSDLEIAQAIDYLNHKFATNPQGDTGIRFELAKHLSDCTETNGIYRVNGIEVEGYLGNGITIGKNEELLKNLSRWNSDEYYNIWVINKINGKNGLNNTNYAAGFAGYRFIRWPNEQFRINLKG